MLQMFEVVIPGMVPLEYTEWMQKEKCNEHDCQDVRRNCRRHAVCRNLCGKEGTVKPCSRLPLNPPIEPVHHLPLRRERKLVGAVENQGAEPLRLPDGLI